MIDGPNVIWYGDLFQEPITERVKTGLFSSQKVIKGFRYHLGVQFGLCRGPIDALKRVWIGDQVVFDGTTTTNFDIDEPEMFGGEDLGSGGTQATVELYLGSHGQSVSTYIARFQNSGAGATFRTPNYTGTCHLVARELGGNPASCRGAYLGNSTTIRPWKFEIERYPGLFSGQTSGENKIGVDCNPMNVAYELLTNVEWGFGFPAADIDVGPGSSWLDASDTLISEVNGFSMVLDRRIESQEFLREIERQIDGTIYLDHRTGKWKIKLVRADYVIGSVAQFTDDNVKEIRDFTRGSWEDTTNQIVVKFNHRDNDYKESFALAQDMANAMIQGGGTILTPTLVATEVVYPGVKNPELAAQLAWRDMRVLSFPLARATFTVSREFWDLTVGSVFAWTSAKFDFTQKPMRVTRIDYGRLQQNQIEVSAVQDVFDTLNASYGFPPTTGWLRPTASLVAYPANEQLAIAAPRAIMARDPELDQTINPPESVSKVFAACRRQNNESAVHVTIKRNGTDSDFIDAGNIVAFMPIGKLQSSLPSAAANPTSTITILPDPDAQATLEGSFDDTLSDLDLGVDLAQLIMVGNEFMLVRSAANNAGNVDLQGVWRGCLDSAQEAHLANDRVYMLFVGAGLGSVLLPSEYGLGSVDVRLRMRSPTAEFSGTVTTISLTVDRRSARPYTPAAIVYNGAGSPFTTPSLESAGAGLNGFRIDTTWWRRNFRTTDEVTSLQADDSSVDATHETQLEVRADPAGANTLVGAVSAWVTGAGPLQVLRSDIITAAAAGTLLRFKLKSRHDIDVFHGVGVINDLESRHTLVHDVTPTSGLTGQFYFGGGLAANVASASYTAAATGTFTLNIGAAQSTANIQVSINGGAFATVIAAGATTGTFAATSADTIRVRRTVSEAPNPNFVELRNPSNVAVGYGTFKN